MVFLGNEQRSFCHSWECTQVLYFRPFCWQGYSISFKGSVPTVVNILSSELNLPILVHLSLLIPKMLMFNLAISCLTTSNLPWFMDLKFQVPMQYYLQHWSLFPLPITSRTWCFIWFWLSLFILSGVISPLIYSSMLCTYQLGEFLFQCPIFLTFHTVHGILKARILKWFAIPFSSGLHFVRTLHHDLSILGGPRWHGS